MPIQLYEDYHSDDGPNRYPAAHVVITWLRDLKGYSDDLRVSANTPPHTVLREWWSARKNDPDFIRAVAERLPIPPLKRAVQPSERNKPEPHVKSSGTSQIRF